MAHRLTAGAIHWKFPDHNITTSENEITLFEPGPVPTQAEIDAKAGAEAKAVTGKQKLKDLGLDDDEIKSLMRV